MRTIIAAAALALAMLAGPALADYPRTTTEEGLRAFIEGLRGGGYDPQDVNRRVAGWLDRNSGRMADVLRKVGAVKSVRFIETVERRRTDIYIVEFEEWPAIWSFGRSLDSGKIRHFRYCRL